MGEQADRLARGEWYLDDEDLQRRRGDCWIQLDSFNSARADDDTTRARVLLNLMGSVGERAMVMPRFQCSYGSNISIGQDAFVNANAFFMDDAPITIGEHARIGPGAQLMTALHPVDEHQRRREGWERAAPSRSPRTCGSAPRSLSAQGSPSARTPWSVPAASSSATSPIT